MKKINILSVFITALVFIIPMLYSCKPTCECEKGNYCTILTVKNVLSDEIIQQKTFCVPITDSAESYYNKIYIDSIRIFYNRFETDSTIISIKDTTRNYIRIDDIPRKEINRYRKEGYACGCSL